MTTKDPSVAETLGKAYAHLQHGMDRVIGWGFKKMRETDEQQVPSTGKIARAGRGILGFIGRMGDAYYEAYDRLKGKDPPAV